ncbi:outer membrane lipoprotein carrier protein [Alphaproteobacteria bacterium]
MLKGIFSRFTQIMVVYIILLKLCLVGSLAFGDECSAEMLQKIENYFNNLKVIQAEFVQLDNDGTTQKGALYLRKPDKVKFEYLSPKHKVLLVNGDKVTYYDYELEEASYLPGKSTAIALLAKGSINIQKDLAVKKCTIIRNELEVLLGNIDPETNLDLLIVLQIEPMCMSNIATVDGDLVVSELTFHNVQHVTTLDKKIFEFKDPRFFNLNDAERE